MSKHGAVIEQAPYLWLARSLEPSASVSQCAQCLSNERFIVGLTFPNRHDAEPHLSQLRAGEHISVFIRRKFGQPEGTVGSWNRGLATSLMSVPETTMDEHRPLTSSIGEIG